MKTLSNIYVTLFVNWFNKTLKFTAFASTHNPSPKLQCKYSDSVDS